MALSHWHKDISTRIVYVAPQPCVAARDKAPTPGRLQQAPLAPHVEKPRTAQNCRHRPAGNHSSHLRNHVVALQEGVLVAQLQVGEGVVDMAVTRLIRPRVQDEVAHRSILVDTCAVYSQSSGSGF